MGLTVVYSFFQTPPPRSTGLFRMNFSDGNLGSEPLSTILKAEIFRRHTRIPVKYGINGR